MCKLLVRIPFALSLLVLLFPTMTHAHNEAEEKVVASSQEAGVSLYAVKREGYLERFRLEQHGGSLYFPWRNTANKTFYPELHFNDINQDGKKDLIIVLTLDHGTGLIEQEVHVLHKTQTNIGEVYREILVDNPIAILLKNVKTKLTNSKAVIKIGNETTAISIKKMQIDPEQLFSKINIRNLIKFDVINNELTAIIGAQISSAGGYIGSFYISYQFKDDMYQAKKIAFVPVEKEIKQPTR